MEATKATRRERVNPIGEGSSSIQFDEHDLVSGKEVQTIIEYLQFGESRSFEQVAGRCKLPRVYLELVLEALEAEGTIKYTSDFDEIQLARRMGGDQYGR